MLAKHNKYWKTLKQEGQLLCNVSCKSQVGLSLWRSLCIRTKHLFLPLKVNDKHSLKCIISGRRYMALQWVFSSLFGCFDLSTLLWQCCFQMQQTSVSRGKAVIKPTVHCQLSSRQPAAKKNPPLSSYMHFYKYQLAFKRGNWNQRQDFFGSSQ